MDGAFRKIETVVKKALGQPRNHSAVTECSQFCYAIVVVYLECWLILLGELKTRLKFCKQLSSSDSRILVKVSYQVFNFVNKDTR